MGDASRLGVPIEVLHQAVGMTMEHLNCSGTEAYTALLTRARETGRSPLIVAADVVERRFRFDQDRKPAPPPGT